MIGIRRRPGRAALFLLMLTVIVSDSSAGTTPGGSFGRRPLAPIVSPKKTIEGAIGGFVFGTALFATPRRVVAAGDAGRRCASASA